ncbi:MAG: NADH/ubiquinone/plastoquinone (complex I) [Candidatus Marinimicrobia bacterium]|nr:NADH/ubiquinone/plastoquinone (complex I) [Candidatus Neomarinimicrobiota bacterium]
MIIPYLIIMPLLAAFLITLISGKGDTWGVIFSILTEITLIILSVIGFILVLENPLVYNMSGWNIPYTITLVMDSFTGFMLVIVHVIALLALMYSVAYIRHLSKSWKYYALFMLLITGMDGVILTGDLFNLFVFMEIGLFAAYALVAYGNRPEEFEASFKYAVMGSISSTLILVGIGIVYSVTSTLNLAKISEVLATQPVHVVNWIGAIFLVGFGLKAAAMPFHAWLPDAHSSAPAPISSMLSGVLIKALGVYVLIRLIFNVFGFNAIFSRVFLGLGTLSIIAASLLAISQWDMKRLLAYSSVSQVGFILIALGIGTRMAIFGALFHLLNHAIFKGLLFLNAGTVEMCLGTRDLKKMGRLGKVLPITTGTSMIGTLAVSGLPPFNGFFSKLIIIIAAIEAGFFSTAGVAVVGSLLTLAYFMKFQRYGFFGDKVIEILDHKPGLGMQTAMVCLAVLCLVTSILVVPQVRELVMDPVINAVLNQAKYIELVLGR